MESSSVAVSPFLHQPVLASEVLEAFAALPERQPDGRPPRLIDCTLGGGGHSALLLAAHPGLELIGLDQDPTARAAAAEVLAPFADRATVVARPVGRLSPPPSPSAWWAGTLG